MTWLPLVVQVPSAACASRSVAQGDEAGIYLVVHEERGSRRANHLEAAIIERVLALAL